MFQFIEKKLAPLSNKIGGNAYMLSIAEGMSATLTITIIASIFMIIAEFPIEGWSDFLGKWYTLLSIPYTVLMGLLSLVVTVTVSNALAKRKEIDTVSAILVTMSCFAITCFDPESFAFDTTNFGSAGMFTAIVLSLIVVTVLALFEKKNITLRLPNSVPPAVANSFTVLISGTACVLLVWIITFVCGININDTIVSLFKPLVSTSSSLLGILTISFISSLLWVVGLSGEYIIMGIVYPIWFQQIAENSSAFLAGEAIPNIAPYGFYFFSMWLGAGTTLILGIYMLRSKSKTYQALGKVTTIPSVFCIAEPTLYGMPVIFNVPLMIGFIVVQAVLVILSYGATALGLIDRVCAMIPWATPPILSGFLATGGDWKAAVFQAFEIVIAFVIWYPFFKLSEKQQLIKEAQELEMEKSESE